MPPCPTTSTAGYKRELASRSCPVAASTRAAARRRSAFCSSASVTRARRAESPRVASHPFTTGVVSTGAAFHPGGSFAAGSASAVTWLLDGGCFKEHPTSAPAADTRRMAGRNRAGRRTAAMLVQLEDEVVELRADSDDHLANEVDGNQVLGVDGALAARACRQEYRGVHRLQLGGEPTRREILLLGLRQLAGGRQLALALSPDHPENLTFDELPGNGVH